MATGHRRSNRLRRSIFGHLGSTERGMAPNYLQTSSEKVETAVFTKEFWFSVDKKLSVWHLATDQASLQTDYGLVKTATPVFAALVLR